MPKKKLQWPKRQFCRPQLAEFNILRVQTNWLNQTVGGGHNLSSATPSLQSTNTLGHFMK